MPEDNDSDNEIQENYYTFLNIPRDATIEQINASYRKLSRIYHPDKHTEPEKKHKAEMLFNRVKKAYEILSDPNKRVIYDNLGEKGLRRDDWQIIQRTKTPAEILQEYERLVLMAEERKLLQSTNPRGNVTIHINATEIFSPYDDSEFPHIEMSSMSISQSIEAPISRRDTIALNGNLISTNGTGTGTFIVCSRRLLNRSWVELDVGAGNGLYMGMKGGRNLTPIVNVNGGANLSFRRNGVLPGLFSTLAVQFDKHTVGTLTLNASSQSSMTTQIDRGTDKYAWSTSFVIGTPHIYFTISYTHKLIEEQLKLKIAAKFGTFGFLAEYGAEKKISKYSTIFASVSVGIPTGVILKFKIARSQQTYIFPIHLSEDIVPAAVFYATITPIIAWFFIKKSIVDPMLAERRNTEIEKMKRDNEQRLALRREEAAAAIDLMRYTYERVLTEEIERNGLIITSAIYGCLNETGNDFRSNASIDVKIPLQCLVKDGHLTLYNASKSDLPGFYDVGIGENKILRIRYKHNDIEKSIEIKDLEPLRLPLL